MEAIRARFLSERKISPTLSFARPFEGEDSSVAYWGWHAGLKDRERRNLEFDPLLHFLPMHCDLPWSIDPKPNRFALDRQRGNDNSVANNDGLILPPTDGPELRPEWSPDPPPKLPPLPEDDY
jgi:hypothetical protein